jgi:hypothetical protein
MNDGEAALRDLACLFWPSGAQRKLYGMGLHRHRSLVGSRPIHPAQNHFVHTVRSTYNGRLRVVDLRQRQRMITLRPVCSEDCSSSTRQLSYWCLDIISTCFYLDQKIVSSGWKSTASLPSPATLAGTVDGRGRMERQATSASPPT